MLELEMVVLEEATLPSWKGDLLVILISITTPCRFSPGSWLRIAGGCMQLMKCDLLTEIFHKLLQLLVCKVTKLCLEVMQSVPTWVRVTSWQMRVTLPPEGRDHSFEWSPPTIVVHALI